MNQPYYTPEMPEMPGASSGTFRPIRMNESAIIQRVSKELYADPSSGVRELFANEIRAANDAKEKYNVNPHIEVTIRSGMIRIWGVESLGIDRKTFDEIYMCLGRSSNFDGTKPGQFGLGRAAYTTLADHILIETKHRNGDCYSVLGVEGRGYQTDIGIPNIPYGTRVTLAPTGQAKDYEARIVKTVTRMAARTHIPVTLVTDDETIAIEYEPILLDDMLCFDTPDVEFAIRTTPFANTTSVDAYLCGIPIDVQYDGKYNRRIQNIKLDIRDERKYLPTPDRERLTEKARADIIKLIDTEIKNTIDTFPTDIIGALKRRDLKKIYPLLNNGLLDKYVIRYGSRYEVRLGDLAGGLVIGCKTFRRAKIDAVLEHFPDAQFIRGLSKVEQIDEFMARHGIKPLKQAVAKRNADKAKTSVIHYSDGVMHLFAGEEQNNLAVVYRVANGAELNKFRHLYHICSNVGLTIHDVRGAVPMDRAVADALGASYETSEGVITGRELVAMADKIRVYTCNRRGLMYCWRNRGGNEEFKQMLVMHPDTDEHYRQFAILSILEFNIRAWKTNELRGSQWAAEIYLKLDNPLHKAIIMRTKSMGFKLANKLLELEGKPPISKK